MQFECREIRKFCHFLIGRWASPVLLGLFRGPVYGNIDQDRPKVWNIIKER